MNDKIDYSMLKVFSQIQSENERLRQEQIRELKRDWIKIAGLAFLTAIVIYATYRLWQNTAWEYLWK